MEGRSMNTTPSPLLAIAPGPTRVLQSSSSMLWPNLLLERHISSPGSRNSTSINSHVISLTCSPNARFEHRTGSGYFVSCLNRAGAITISPTGPVPDVRLHTTSEFLHCALDEGFISCVMDELDCHVVRKPSFLPGIQEKSIERILMTLAEELETAKPSGRLYVDSLAYALATRYLTLDCATLTRPSDSRVSALPTRILNRVRQKIEANLDTDLSLESLADESGYSRAHFLRMFRAATGLTPHQYVLELRLTHAKYCLTQKGSSLIDTALTCGFSSQSHMTSVFRQHLGVTPAEFRRNSLSSSAALFASLA